MRWGGEDFYLQKVGTCPYLDLPLSKGLVPKFEYTFCEIIWDPKAVSCPVQPPSLWATQSIT